MKFVMYARTHQAEPFRPGIVWGEDIVDLQLLLSRLGMYFPKEGSLRYFIEMGERPLRLISKNKHRLRELTEPGLIPQKEALVNAPLLDTRKLILLAGNYREHICEAGFRVPPSGKDITPQFFMKPPSTAIIGPGKPITLSKNNIWVDWEVELAVIISRKGKHISTEDAMDYVFGYTIINDISEREFNTNLEQRFDREKDPFFDWLHGKWFDGFAPMGPAIVSKDEILDPHKLEMSLSHNGIEQQIGSTADMLHSVPYLIHKLSEIMTVEPGDVIATGTPEGVGYSQGIRLSDGDKLSCHIEKIGYLQNPVAAEGPAKTLSL